jgi:hypothetical protein
VGVEVPQHETAAVQEQDGRPWSAILSCIVQAERDAPGRTGRHKIADNGEITCRRVRYLAGGVHHAARFDRADFVAAGTGEVVQVIEETTDVRADIGFGHGLLLARQRPN